MIFYFGETVSDNGGATVNEIFVLLSTIVTSL